MFRTCAENQAIPTLQFELLIPKNDIAYAIHHLIEKIPDKVFNPFLRTTGSPAYNPRMMMKIILCAYTQSVFSGRGIAALLKDSLRMMWLSQGHRPSYRTINRFRVHPDVAPLLKAAFVTFRHRLVNSGEINEDAIFIDGTIIEANAKLNSAIWRTNVMKHISDLANNSNLFYAKLVKRQTVIAIERENTESLTSNELDCITSRIKEHMLSIDQKIKVSGDSKEKKRLHNLRKLSQNAWNKMKIYSELHLRYKKQLFTLGTRKSYSTTDPDATFMRMKGNFKNNFLLKPAYNVQIATERQYTLAYDVYSNQMDADTLIPFLDEIETYFELPNYIVTDASYGSKVNFLDVVVKRGRIPLFPQKVFNIEQMNTLYKKEEIYFLKTRRKIDVEPVFGFLKANLGFTRFSVRGKQGVKSELGFVLMAVNLRKWVLQRSDYV